MVKSGIRADCPNVEFMVIGGRKDKKDQAVLDLKNFSIDNSHI